MDNASPRPSRATRAAALLAEAQNPATTPDRLDELSQAATGHAVKAAVAQNPNTPRRTLLRLAGRYWEAFLQNPVLPLLLLEDPGLPNRLPLRVLRGLVRRPEVPPYLLQTLARHEDREVREGAKYHVALQAENVQGADGAEDWPTTLRRELEKLPAQRATLPELLDLDVMPPWLLESVAATNNPGLRAALLASSRRPNASPALKQIGKLVRRAFGEWETETWVYSWGESEHRVLNGQAALTEAEALRLADGSLSWQIQAARSMALPVAALEKLARHAHWKVRAAVARHSKLTPTIAMMLASRGEEPVLRALAQNRQTPATLLASLARSSFETVRRGVARHAQTPPPTLAQLAADADASVRLGAASNRYTPEEALRRLATDPDPDIRERVGKNGGCTPAIYEILAADESEEVRESIARRTGLPAEAIRRFLDDPSEDVRFAAAYNYSTPRHILDFMTDCSMNPPDERPPLPEWGTGKGWGFGDKSQKPLSPDDDAKVSRIYNKTATEDEQRAWATSSTKRVRAAVGNHSKLPDVLAQLAADPKTHVRAAVGRNSGAPVAILAQLAQDPKTRVRAAVAGNHQHPDPDPTLGEVLRPLAADPKAAVRYQAAINQCVPPEALVPLATDPKAKVRGHLAFNPALPPEAIEILDADPSTTPNTRRGILTHANTPLVILLRRFGEATNTELEHLAHNPQLPPDYLRQIADRCWEIKDVRSALAHNPNTPPDLLERLWDRPREGFMDFTLGTVAKHPNTSSELLQRVAAHEDPSVASYVAQHPHFSETLFRELLPLMSLKAKQYVLYGNNLPAFVYDVLLEEGVEKVLQTMARMKDTPLPIRQALMERIKVERYGSDSIAYTTAHNPTTPPELLGQLLDKFAEIDATKDGPQWWYQYIAANPNATPELLDRLVALLRQNSENYRYHRYRSGRGNDAIALNLVNNPKLRTEHLPFFADHESREVRYALLQRPDCPPELKAKMRTAIVQRNLEKASSLLGRAAALADAATKEDWLRHLYPQARWLERLAMVENPNLPADLLAQLAQDTHRLVRAAAQERLSSGRVPELSIAPAA